MELNFPVRRHRFDLFIRSDASPELRQAHSRYVRAVEASWGAKVGVDVLAAWQEIEDAHRAYGLVLLREDKARNPQRYVS